MSRRQHRIVYRSWVRLVLFVPAGGGLAVIGGAAAITGAPPLAALVLLGLLLAGYALWPRLVVTDEGVIVRNTRSRSITWWDLRRPGVEAQLPYLGRTWQIINRLGTVSRGGPGFGKQGYPGLVLHTKSKGACAVVAVPSNVFLPRGFAYRVAAALEVGRHAAKNHQAPVAAIRSGNRHYARPHT